MNLVVLGLHVPYLREGKLAPTMAPPWLCSTGFLPAPETWPHRPLFLCADNDVLKVAKEDKGSDDACDDTEQTASLPIGTPFRIENDIFGGKVMVRIRNLHGDDAYFEGRKRKVQTVIQGQFKKKISMDKVVAMQKFHKPLRTTRTARFLIRGAEAFLTMLNPGVKIDLLADEPQLVSLLAGYTQVLRADRPGSEPSIDHPSLQEDTSLLFGVSSKSAPSSVAAKKTRAPISHVTREKRRKLLSHPDSAAEHFFDTDLVYTFEMYEDLTDYVNFETDLGALGKCDIAAALGGQPYSFGAMNEDDGSWIYRFYMYHERQILEHQTQKELN